MVDIANLGSIETGWPYGCYDRSRIRPPIVFRHGAASERYEGIGKRTWHPKRRPVLADTEGPFGSPISDSTRSMITRCASEILLVTSAPAELPGAPIEAAIVWLAERLSQFARPSAIRTNICAQDRVRGLRLRQSAGYPVTAS